MQVRLERDVPFVLSRLRLPSWGAVIVAFVLVSAVSFVDHGIAQLNTRSGHGNGIAHSSIRDVSFHAFDELQLELVRRVDQQYLLIMRRATDAALLGMWQLDGRDGPTIICRLGGPVYVPVQVTVRGIDERTGEYMEEKSVTRTLSPFDFVEGLLAKVDACSAREDLAQTYRELIRVVRGLDKKRTRDADFPVQVLDGLGQVATVLETIGLSSPLTARLRKSIPHLVHGRQFAATGLARRLESLRVIEMILGTPPSQFAPFGDVSRQLGFVFGSPRRWPNRNEWRLLAEGQLTGVRKGLALWLMPRRNVPNEQLGNLAELAAGVTNYGIFDSSDLEAAGLKETPGVDELQPKAVVPFSVADGLADKVHRCFLELDTRFFSTEHRLLVSFNDSPKVPLVDWGEQRNSAMVERVAIPMALDGLREGRNELRLTLEFLPGQQAGAPLCVEHFRVVVR